jgi:acyl dehydratase
MKDTRPMTQPALGPYRVTAFNTATQSENLIHDDAVARRFGFKGGLVPGVEVYAYLTHLPVAQWGRVWLERGMAECRLLKPVYDGDAVVVSGTATAEGLELRLESEGELCATARAALPAEGSAVPAALAAAAPPPKPPAHRPPADERTLAPGTWLAIHPFRVGADEARQYLSEVSETLPLYMAEGLVHPATILHIGNWALRHNVVLGPWMHVGSRIEHFAAARIGEELSARALVTANYDRKGHRFVELDLLVYADGDRPLARIAHIAIYRPRSAG